ncbi:hypothetical protein Taro_049922 [Colocasia esculenta]|uniref:Uncharacterized protein n=1 Tax=Colocasia esculenta TaxID=4460 RepID=A0A843XC31_COLES|nr:hypothetical protein [Colocasia esculenta]
MLPGELASRPGESATSTLNGMAPKSRQNDTKFLWEGLTYMSSNPVSLDGEMPCRLIADRKRRAHCPGHSPAAAAAVVAIAADIAAGRAGTAVVVAIVVVAAAAVAFAVAVVASDPVGPSKFGLIFSSLPNQSGSAHGDHISCPGIGSNQTHCGPDDGDRRSTLFDRPPYSNLPSQEGVLGHLGT